MLTARSASDAAWPARLKEVLPFLICVVWFFLFLSHNLSVAHDSMDFLLRAATGHNLWHANHLLTLPLMAFFINAGKALNAPLSPLELATIPNILCGALTVQIVYLFLRRRLQLSYRDSLLGCSLPALSFGIWYYSVAIEAYAIPVFLMLLCIYLLTDEHRTERTFLLVAVIHSVAALFHQFAILLSPLVVYAFFATPWIEPRRRLKLFAQYFLITALLVGGTNVWVALAVDDVSNVAGFVAWLLGNAGAEGASQFVGGFELKTIAIAIVGFGRALVGGHFAFAVPELNELLSRVFGAQSLDDERFLVKSLTPAMARVLAIMAVVWGIALLVAVIRSVRCLRDARHTPPIVMILWVFVPMSLVFTFYFGQNVELWLVQSVCFWILIAWALAKLQARRTLHALLAGLLVINVFGSMQFVGNAGKDFHQWRLQPILANLQHGDLIVIGDWWPTAAFVEYFAETEPLALSRRYMDEADTDSVTEFVARHLGSGGRVFVYDDVYHIDRSAVTYYGQVFVKYVERFRQSIPSADPLAAETGRQHTLIVGVER